MTPVTKQAWIDALRSGKYKQARGALARVDEDGCTSYCCLGVLADIAGAAVIDSDGDSGRLTFDFGDGSIEDAVIPLSVRSTIVTDLDLDLQVIIKKYGSDDLMRTLSTKNDDGVTFEGIATYLEKLA